MILDPSPLLYDPSFVDIVIKQNTDASGIPSAVANKLLSGDGSNLSLHEKKLKNCSGWAEYNFQNRCGVYRILYSLKEPWYHAVVEPVEVEINLLPNWPRQVVFADSFLSVPVQKAQFGVPYDYIKLLLADRYNNPVNSNTFPLDQTIKTPLNFKIEFNDSKLNSRLSLTYDPLLHPVPSDQCWCIKNLTVTPKGRLVGKDEVKYDPSFFSAPSDSRTIQLKVSFDLTEEAKQFASEHEQHLRLLDDEELAPLRPLLSLRPGNVSLVRFKGWKKSMLVYNGKEFGPITLTTIDHYMNPSCEYDENTPCNQFAKLAIVQGKELFPNRMREVKEKEKEGKIDFAALPLHIPSKTFFEKSHGGEIELKITLDYLKDQPTKECVVTLKERWGPYKLKVFEKRGKREEGMGMGSAEEAKQGAAKDSDMVDVSRGTEEKKENNREQEEEEGPLRLSCPVGEDILLCVCALTEGGNEISIGEIKSRYPHEMWDACSVEIQGLDTIKDVPLREIDDSGVITGLKLPNNVKGVQQYDCGAYLKYAPSGPSAPSLPPNSELLPLSSMSPATEFHVIPVFGAPYRWKIESFCPLRVGVTIASLPASSSSSSSSSVDAIRMYVVDKNDNVIPIPSPCLLPILRFSSPSSSNTPYTWKWRPQRDESNIFFRVPNAFCTGIAGNYQLRVTSQTKDLEGGVIEPGVNYPELLDSAMIDIKLLPGIASSLIALVNNSPITSLSIHRKDWLPNILIQFHDRANNIILPRDVPAEMRFLLPVKMEIKCGGTLFYKENLEDIDSDERIAVEERYKYSDNNGIRQAEVKLENYSSSSSSSPSVRIKETTELSSSHTLASYSSSEGRHDSVAFPRLLAHIGEDGLKLQNQAQQAVNGEGNVSVSEEEQWNRPHLVFRIINSHKPVKPLRIRLDVTPTPLVISSLSPLYQEPFIVPSSQRSFFSPQFLSYFSSHQSFKYSLALLNSRFPSLIVRVQTEDNTIPSDPSLLPPPSSFQLSVFAPSHARASILGCYKSPVLLNAESGEYLFTPSERVREEEDSQNTMETEEEMKEFSTSSISLSPSSLSPSSSSPSSSVMCFNETGKWKFVVHYTEQRDRLLPLLLHTKERVIESSPSTIEVFPQKAVVLARKVPLQSQLVVANSGREEHRRLLSSLVLHLFDERGNLVNLDSIAPSLLEALSNPQIEVIDDTSFNTLQSANAHPPSLAPPSFSIDKGSNALQFSRILIAEGSAGESGHYLVRISLPVSPPFSPFIYEFPFEFVNDLEKIAEVQRANQRREQEKSEREAKRQNLLETQKSMSEGIELLEKQIGMLEGEIQSFHKDYKDMHFTCTQAQNTYALSIDIQNGVSGIHQSVQTQLQSVIKMIHQQNQPIHPSPQRDIRAYLASHQIESGKQGYLGQIYDLFTVENVEEGRLLLWMLGRKVEWFVFDSDTCHAAVEARRVMSSDEFKQQFPKYSSQFIYLKPPTLPSIDYSIPPPYSERHRGNPRYAANSLKVQPRIQQKEVCDLLENMKERLMGSILMIDSMSSYREYRDYLIQKKLSCPSCLILKERTMRTELNSEMIGASASPDEYIRYTPRFPVVDPRLFKQHKLLAILFNQSKSLKEREEKIKKQQEEKGEIQARKDALQQQFAQVQENLKEIHRALAAETHAPTATSSSYRQKKRR